MSTNDNYGRSFTVAINGDLREFHIKDNFKNYLTEEIESWRWLIESALPPGVGPELYKNFCSKELETPRLIIEREDNPNYVYNIGKPDLGLTYLEKITIEKNVIENTLKEFGEITAAYTLIYISNQKNLITSSGTIAEFLSSPVYSYERATALQVTFNKNNLNQRITKVDIETSSTMLQQFASELLARNNVLDERKNEFFTRTSSIEEVGEKSNIRRAKIFKRRVNFYKKIASKVHSDARDSLEKAKTDLSTAESTYFSQIQLSASVKYWKDRKKEHSKLKINWLLSTAATMILTFGLLAGYYGLGGLSRLTGHAYSAPLVAVPVSSAPTSLSTTPNPGTSTTGTTPPLDTEPLKSNPAQLANIIADLAGAILLISLLTVLIRITLRQYNTHSFLENEATERVTLTETYLALLNEGNLEAKEDRRLILECLFRASQVGGLSEIQVATPVELILKTISKKE
ncbi:hypothetical protein HER21_11290 [Pseudomonas sp. BGM005]|nr:hypothetical protein [Pseudomonas sp. BG5]